VSAISAGIGADGTAGAGQILSANSNATIGGDGDTVVLSAGTGIGIPGTPIDTDATTLEATTTTGGVYINETAGQAGSGATADITTSNGSIVSVSPTPASGGTGYAPNSTFDLEVTGGGGTGGVVEAMTNSSGVMTTFATTPVTLGGGYASTPSGSAAVSTSDNFMLLNASTSNGDIRVTGAASADLILDGISAGPGGTLTATSNAAILNTSSVNANSATGSANSGNTTSAVTAATLVLTATDGIGTASNPLETSVNNLTVSGASLFLTNNTALTVNSATAANGDLSITATGNLIALGNLFASAAATLTATDGTLTTGNMTISSNPVTTTGLEVVTPAVMEPYIIAGAQRVINAGQSDAETVTVAAVTATTFAATFANTHTANFTISTATSVNPDNVSISADSLTITAEQIGLTSDVVQTSATTIDATANYGGIYLSNSNTGKLTLSAASVGPILGSGPTNNIEIYSAGNIALQPQTTNLTNLATTEPIAAFNPGGFVTLYAGETLSAIGNNATTQISSATVTSAGDSNPYYDIYTGAYDINGAKQFSDSFITSNNGGLDAAWTVQTGSFTVDTTSQTATATGTTNLATVSNITSVNESVSATISGTLTSGHSAGLVALYSSTDSFYYGFIVATSSNQYDAFIYSVDPTHGSEQLDMQVYTGSVGNAVLEFSVASSSLTLLLNGSTVPAPQARTSRLQAWWASLPRPASASAISAVGRRCKS
jgi:hypothetical protein